MSHAIEFIETPMFTRQIKQIATDEELRELQKTLIESPDKGDLIQKTGGLRKIRMATVTPLTLPKPPLGLVPPNTQMMMVCIT